MTKALGVGFVAVIRPEKKESFDQKCCVGKLGGSSRPSLCTAESIEDFYVKYFGSQKKLAIAIATMQVFFCMCPGDRFLLSKLSLCFFQLSEHWFQQYSDNHQVLLLLCRILVLEGARGEFLNIFMQPSFSSRGLRHWVGFPPKEAASAVEEGGRAVRTCDTSVALLSARLESTDGEPFSERGCHLQARQ